MNQKLVPLYHGTRSFYQESILKNGLRVPTTQAANIVNYLTLGFDLLAEKFSFDWKTGLESFPSCLLCEDELYYVVQAALRTGGRMSFNYGTLFLTPSFARAKNYASSIPESVRFGFKMHDILFKNDIHLQQHPFHELFLPIRRDIESSAPLVFEVTQYKLELLFEETTLEKLKPTAGTEQSFEYRGSIAPDVLRIV